MPDSIDKQDDAVISVLEYLMKHEYGYMADLEQHCDTNIITGLKILGFLHTGYTHKAETYAITPMGKQYYNIMKMPHKSLFAKIFQRKR